MTADPRARALALDAELARHAAVDAEERDAVDRTRALLLAAADPFARTTLPGHVTASGIVLDESREHVLLVWHEGLHRWLQPGGHSEPDDESTLATALREVAEETGVILPRPAVGIAHVEVHEIPARGAEPDHLHHDIRYAFTAPLDAASPLGEGRTHGWVPVSDLGRLRLDATLERAIERAVRGR